MDVSTSGSFSSSSDTVQKQKYNTDLLTTDTICALLAFLDVPSLVSLLYSNIILEIPNQWWISKGRTIFQQSIDVILSQKQLNDYENNQKLVNDLSRMIQNLLKYLVQSHDECVNIVRDLRLCKHSSVDRDEERPHNILTSSSCITNLDLKVLDFNFLSPTQLGIRSQIICGCAASEPCYWSTAPSSDENMHEFVEFEADNNIISAETNRSINGITIICYQAYCHPGAPIYAPKHVRVELSHPYYTDDKNASSVYWRSQDFPIAYSRSRQKFLFEYPALFFGDSKMRIVFTGAQQRQTLNEVDGHNEDYYICISHLELLSDVVCNNILNLMLA